MSTGRSVLVVDDDFDIRQSVEDGLRLAGYDVFSAGNGIEALRALSAIQESPHPCVVVTDFQMPDIDGRAVAHAVRRTAAFSLVRVLMLSAVPRVDSEADATMTKPFDFDELRGTVQHLFDSMR